MCFPQAFTTLTFPGSPGSRVPRGAHKGPGFQHESLTRHVTRREKSLASLYLGRTQMENDAEEEKAGTSEKTRHFLWPELPWGSCKLPTAKRLSSCLRCQEPASPEMLLSGCFLDSGIPAGLNPASVSTWAGFSLP